MATDTRTPILDACGAFTNARKAWNQSEGGTEETKAFNEALWEVERLDKAFTDMLEALCEFVNVTDGAGEGRAGRRVFLARKRAFAAIREAEGRDS